MIIVLDRMFSRLLELGERLSMKKINFFYPLIKQKKYFICYLVAVFCLVFVSNIFLHIFTYESEDSYVQAEINHTSGYEVNGNEFIPINEDPQLYIRYSQDSINKLRFELDEPLQEDTKLQIYYPDKNKQYSEEHSSFFNLPAGKAAIDLDIPTGEHGVLRLDINSRFKLSRILLTVNFRTFYYARTKLVLACWCACFVIAYFFCGIFYHIFLLRKFLYKEYVKFYDNVYSKITLKRILSVLYLILPAILISVVLEFVSSIVTGKAYNIKEFYIFACVFVIILSFIKFRNYYKCKIELVVMLFLLLCGITFSFVMPISVGISWDDHLHYSNAVQDARINQSHNKFQSAENHFTINLLYDEYERSVRQERDTERNELYRSGQTDRIPEQLIHSFSIKDLGYIPAIIGTWISWGLCLPFTGTIILTRIINVLFFAIMIYLSMKNVKSGKMLIAIFALVPTVFFLASSFSYDTWLTVLLIYGFSRYFRELQHREEKLTWGRFLGIFVPLFLALGPKMVYAPILFLTAYMPNDKFKEKKWCYAYRGCFVFAAAVMVAVLCYVASGRYDMGVGDTRGGETVNAMQQLMYIKSNFSEFRTTLITFLKDYFSYAKSADYLTFMAYMGINSMQWISVSLLFFTALTDRTLQDRKTIPIISKISAVFMYIVIGAICAIVMYIAFTPVGLTTINGCQGRYILPAVLPVLYMITRFGGKVVVRQKVKAEYYNMALIGISVIFLMYNLWINCAVKY